MILTKFHHLMIKSDENIEIPNKMSMDCYEWTDIWTSKTYAPTFTSNKIVLVNI